MENEFRENDDDDDVDLKIKYNHAYMLETGMTIQFSEICFHVHSIDDPEETEDRMNRIQKNEQNEEEKS